MYSAVIIVCHNQTLTVDLYCVHCTDRAAYSEPRQITGLLYTCRSISEECSWILSSKTIVEIAPLRPAGCAAIIGNGVEAQSLVTDLDEEYAFLPERLRMSIPVVQIWMHDWSLFTMETLRSLLKSILRNFNPQVIRISSSVTARLADRRNLRTWRDFKMRLSASACRPASLYRIARLCIDLNISG